METIEKIRTLMNERNWSEYRLAKESGLSQSTINNIFLRNTLPSIPTLEIICNTFGLTLSQFFAENKCMELTSEQHELLQMYVKLSDSQKELLKKMMHEFIK